MAPLYVVILFLSFVAIVSSWLERSKKKPKYHRRTSHASAIGANRQFLQEALSMKQNVIHATLFFEEQDGSTNSELMRQDFINMMTTLAKKYERMGSVPYFDVDASGECVWCPIDDLDGSIDKAVIFDSEYDKYTDDVHVLQRAHAHIGTILSTQDEGHAMPLWRVILLSPSAALIRIDHCICDGLSALTLLKEIGTKTSSNEPLTLSDLSPILRAIDKAGDIRISLAPLKLLWPPNLVRAISFLAECLTVGKEPPNPLRPLPEDIGSPIPSANYGTVYFPTMSVSLFKDMARAMGNGTTINDILLLSLSIAFGRYMDALNQHDCDGIDSLKILLPIGNPLRPSTYGHPSDGLCNRMTPVIVPLSIPRQNEETSPLHAIDEIRSYMERVKRSNTPLLMTCLNTILMPLLSLDKLKEAAKHSFEGVSCVYSNVPGPTESISLQASTTGNSKAPSAVTRRYNIKKIQTVLPHPVSIFQVLSYAESMFFNITLDTRSAVQPWILRTAFIDAVKCVADASGVKSKWKEELASFDTSMEWGGNGTVFSCG
eukprot:scaffold12632_cov52-Attheya_sp.AAC.2